MRLSIVFRTCPFLSKKFPGRKISKEESLEIVLGSFFSSLEKSDFQVENFILINDNLKSTDIVSSLVPKHIKLVTVNSQKTGNHGSFQQSLIEALKQDCDYVFFLEDDYYFSAECMKITEQILAKNNPSFFTPYYHPNYDESSILGAKSENDLAAHEGLKLYDCPSTTLTFFARKDALIEHANDFFTFCNGTHDFKLWMDITGKHLKFTDFLNFSKFITMMKLLFFVIFNFRLVKNKKSKLICCFPSLAMHLCKHDKPTKMLDNMSNKYISELFTK